MTKILGETMYDGKQLCEFVTGGVWNTSPVSETPNICLENWSIFQLPDGDRHFAGYNITEGEGRVSSKIVTFDKDTMRGVTTSGRVYELVGKPGLSGDGLYTWGRWCSIYNVATFEDISANTIRVD